ncbi:MAG: HEAT repeat domain-containing protein [Methanomicrobiales archaeon]|nr:HEAT repeat domain-containing protein [Methanomicrobiales archaeon]
MPAAKRGETGEIRLLKEAIANLTCDEAEGRKQALDALMVIAWKPGWKPDRFIELGALPPLIARLGEEDERMRQLAVEIIEKIAELGGSPALKEAGALPVLHQMAASDRYEPVRLTAARTAARIGGER